MADAREDSQPSADGQSSTALPTHAGVVVIGGGAVGSSTLYHLAKLGVEQPVLLERDRLTSGTSWHSAAQVRALRSTENLTRLIQYSVSLYQNLEAETGLATGWVQNGSLSIAANADRLTHIKRQASLARAFGVEADLVGPATAKELWPLMRSDDLLGAVYSSGDGRVNPSDLCASLVRGARNLGARVFEHTPVTGLRLTNGRVSAVVTDRGTIECERVVICAGLWSRSLAALAGARVPLHACEHFYLLTQPIEGIDGHLPTLGDHDHHLYIRDDVGGLLVGCFEPNARAIGLERLPKNFSFDLLDEDWEHFEPMLHNAIERIPALEHAEARLLLNGPESFTPDGGFILGESAEVRELYFGCGMNSMGLASSGGAGWALAEWLVNGKPPFDLSPVDPRRFAPIQNNLRYLAQRAPEVLTGHYDISFPGREPETARGVRKSPLHDRLLERGASFGERAGWERANWFRTGLGRGADAALTFDVPGWEPRVAEECQAARNAVALIDQSSFGKLLVEGRDAENYMQRICANDVGVEPGRCVYSAVLNERGGFESDVVVMRLDQSRFMMITGTAQTTRDQVWLQRHIQSHEHVNVVDATSSWAVLGLHGPSSAALLSRLCSTPLDLQSFPYFTWQSLEVDTCTARALRVSYVGELGWELQVPSEMATALYDAIVAEGVAFGLEPVGAMAMTALRIEKGYRAWGHELTPDDTPLEAGLGFAVRLDKPTPFIGREALRAMDSVGVTRRLCCLSMPASVNESGPRLQGGEPIVYNGRYVGQITSAAFGHTVGHFVAMGYVQSRDSDQGSVDAMLAAGDFEVEIALERYPVEVATTPAYDPKNLRVRGT